MKCTDRDLLQKLLRLKERAEQRRGAQRAQQERAKLGAHALQLRAVSHTTGGVQDMQAGGHERAVAPGTPDGLSEGSIGLARGVAHAA